jgi:hypothetical protein
VTLPAISAHGKLSRKVVVVRQGVIAAMTPRDCALQLHDDKHIEYGQLQRGRPTEDGTGRGLHPLSVHGLLGRILWRFIQMGNCAAVSIAEASALNCFAHK